MGKQVAGVSLVPPETPEGEDDDDVEREGACAIQIQTLGGLFGSDTPICQFAN
jgi:hypothetical protein